MGKKILSIGAGGCGGKLLNSMFLSLESYEESLINTYDGIFINSNAREMEELSYYKGAKNGLLINGGGTGRNTSVAQQSIIDDKIPFTNYFFNKVNDIDCVIIFTSADGGFGGGTTGTIASFIRDMVPDNVAINIVAAMPKLEGKSLSLENACNFHVSIQKLLKNKIINSVQYINNNKMKNEIMFNKKVTDLVVKSYELHGGQVDESDMLLINSCEGYKITLNLNDKFRKLSASLDDALDNSPFIIPPNFIRDPEDNYTYPVQCLQIGVTLDKECYDKELIYTLLPPVSLDKIDYGKNNFIVAGGFDLPNYYTEQLVDKLKELDNVVKDFNNQDEFVFERKKEDKRNEKVTTKDKIDKMKNFKLWLD